MTGIRVEVDDTAVVIKLKRLAPDTSLGVKQVVTKNTLELQQLAVRKVSGEVLKVRSGRLRRSIFQDVTADSEGTVGRVFTSPDVPYARIHEYGGRIQIPEIVPIRARALCFEVGGRIVFAKRVAPHVVEMPERPYMRPSLAEQTPKFEADMEAVAAKVAAA